MTAQLKELFELWPLLNSHFFQPEAYSFHFCREKGLYIC